MTGATAEKHECLTMKTATVRDLPSMESSRGSLACLGISPVLALIAWVALAGVAEGAPQAGPFVLGGSSKGLALNADGALLGWEGRSAENAVAMPSGAGEIRCAGNILKLAKPAAVTREGGGLSFTYRWPEEPGIQVIVRHHWARQTRAWTWTRELEIRSQAKLASDLTVSLESGLRTLPPDTWLPLINGVGAPLGINPAAAYRFAGALPKPGALLALPMLSVPAQQSSPRQRPGRLLLAADPYFSVLYWGGWQGPDSKGRSCIQNPLHPKVRAFYLEYAKALLAEFGPELDALNWDETFHVSPGQLGGEGAPGYADRAMMRLARELSRLVEDYNRKHKRQIAFLTSDCLGAFGQEIKAPYALVAHGTFQDSWCKPQAWSCGIFSNYRNVLWSCCWWPLTKWSWIDFAVRQYQAPVSLSNGWGNDKGFSEMTQEQRARALALFDWRKDKPTRLKWFDRLPAYNNEHR